MKHILLILLTIFTISGCTIVDSQTRSIISTKNYDFINKKLILGKQVTGRVKLPGDKAHQSAIEDAISRNPCTVALINVKEVRSGVIEGTEVIDPTLGNCAP